MTTTEECVSFQNQNNQLLRGILHNADPTNKRNISIVCLNTGLNDMVGWHRIQVKIARYLSQHGYPVLRFDSFGIGGSEGELEEGMVVKIFAQIETGRWRFDAIAALDFMLTRFINTQVVFLGFCGGALTAIHAAAIEKRVMAVINVAGPVTLSTIEYYKHQDPWSVKSNVDTYKKKLISPKAIWSFLTGKSDYSVVFNSIIHYFKHQLLGRYKSSKSKENLNEEVKNLNTSIFESIEKYFKTKRPLLCFYAGLDNATWGFKRYLLPRFEHLAVWKNSTCRFIEVPQANHIFADTDSQEQMKNDIITWLNNL